MIVPQLARHRTSNGNWPALELSFAGRMRSRSFSAVAILYLLRLHCVGVTEGLESKRPWLHSGPLCKVSCAKTDFTPAESAAIRELENSGSCSNRWLADGFSSPLATGQAQRGSTTSSSSKMVLNPPRAPLTALMMLRTCAGYRKSGAKSLPLSVPDTGIPPGFALPSKQISNLKIQNGNVRGNGQRLMYRSRCPERQRNGRSSLSPIVGDTPNRGCVAPSAATISNSRSVDHL
ncbi:hypothetical protein VTI28DRAFT_10534 [Corynascus sepedonium]